ncbi:unnamed protein product [Symbiodinium sp. CCMP2456]|nr:unnamed protein product [Symbiodinium sp. CCMP2456]
MSADPHAVLGTSPGFTFSQLSEAYRRSAATAEEAPRSAGAAAVRRSAAAFEALSWELPGRGLASSSEAPHTAALHRLGKHLLPACTQKCLEPRYLSSRRQPSQLHSALRRLRAALQRLPPQPREEGIRALSPEVRWQLLKFMEASATSASPKVGPKPTKRTKSSEPKTCGLQQNRQGLFRAKISFEHIRLYSSYTLPRAAVEYHILLVRLRQLVMMNTRPQAASASEGVSELCEAFATAFAELEREPVVTMRPRDCLSGEQGLNCFLKRYGIRSYLSIHVARWLGSTHVSSPVLPLGDVLTLRQQLLLARSKGLEAFRDAWLKMLQRLGHSVGHSASGPGSSGHGHSTDAFKDQLLQLNPCLCKKRRRAAEALHEAMGRQRSAGGRKQAVSRKRQDAVSRLRAASCATERALAACNAKRRSSSRKVCET